MSRTLGEMENSNAVLQYLKNRLTGQRFFEKIIDTEAQHHLSKGFAETAQLDLAKAFKQLLLVDEDHFTKLKQANLLESLVPLSKAIHFALKSNNKIFLVGCGASGRLAFVLQRLLSHEKIVPIIAGGDKALISSVECFEDKEIYGQQQLLESGYQKGDVVIGISASGDAPFVQGALRLISKHEKENAFMIVSNTKAQIFARNPHHILKENNIQVIELATGALGLAGSARMQPATITLFVLHCLFDHAINFDDEKLSSLILKRIKQLTDIVDQIVNNQILVQSFCQLIEFESQCYKNKQEVYYCVQKSMQHFALTLFTDLTERAPTFGFPNIQPLFIEKELKPMTRALAYPYFAGTINADEAMQVIYSRKVTALNWKLDKKNESTEKQLSSAYIKSYDFSEAGLKQRIEGHDQKTPIINIALVKENGKTCFHFFISPDVSYKIEVSKLSRIEQELILKILLNTHSLLVMAKIGRVKNNLMTHVTTSNAKLWGRAIYILKEEQNKTLNTKGKLTTIDAEFFLFRAFQKTSNLQELIPTAQRLIKESTIENEQQLPHHSLAYVLTD